MCDNYGTNKYILDSELKLETISRPLTEYYAPQLEKWFTLTGRNKEDNKIERDVSKR